MHDNVIVLVSYNYPSLGGYLITTESVRLSAMIPRPIAPAAALFLVLGWACFMATAKAQTNETLTNAADVLSLPDDKASLGIPVSITGTVTVAETNWSDWAGKFFVQDSSGGVFVESKGQQPKVGDLVKISAVTRAGGYAPYIAKSSWKKIGTAALPQAKPVTIEELMSGTEDGQRIEISGVLRTVELRGNEPIIEVVSGGYRFHAYIPAPSETNLQALVGAKVLLKGTAATAYNAPLRHFVNVTLYIPRADDFVIEQPAPANPYSEPLTPLNAIAQYRKNRPPGSQVHIKGVVTYQREGEDLFLQDASGGLQVKSKLAQPVIPGEVVEAVGFPAVENFLPVLEDAVFRKTGELQMDLMPTNVTVTELQQGLHHADYIALKGVLVDRLARWVGQTADEPVIQTSLVLQNSNFLFEAEKDTTEQNNYLASIPVGSVVEASGVCMLESDQDGKIKSVHVLLPTSHNVRVLEKPSWLTPRHLLTSLALVSLILVVVVSWSVMVSNKNLKLGSLIKEKEAAQSELQQAHDLLEWRVAERTKQLKVEMTARKESELQFRAVLTERTRLAQELHDTLEQTITGIALQLDRVANHFQKNPDSASHHLKLARSLTRQSQTEVRHSVWGLRSRAGEKFNLVNALSVSGRQIAENAGIKIQIETRGETQPLSEIFEENLLRIGQEAITNAIKHSGANTVKLELEFSPQRVMLQIKDDGKGFAPENCAGPNEGHFGLLGIRERAERMGGEANIASAPGTGTTVRVEIPMNQNGNGQCQADAEKHEKGI
jgi:signal transduction histidine kinase